MNCSVIFLTFNSEKFIESSVKAAQKITDDIHAVDSFSSDTTLEILHRLGVKVLQHEFIHYGKQRNWAIENCNCQYEWQLHLDSDEVISDNLVDEIKQLPDSPNCDGFFIPRMPSFLGREIHHGAMYPIWHMRLFKKHSGKCEDRIYDQHFILTGKACKLEHHMVDHVCSNLSSWVARHNNWADKEVEELLSNDFKGRIMPKLNGNPIEKQRYLRRLYEKFPLFIRPFFLFFYRYILRLGFLDGIEGLIFFFLKDFWFRFLIDAKLYEAMKNKKC
jgi:glycosyltransferase involved in cell wall biosynthesis